jgi:Flp pilus assembly pilin Flp
MKDWIKAVHQFLREEEGQSTVEYMLLISVIVIAIVAAAYVFIEPFKQGVQDLANDVKKILSDGKIGRVGTTR